MGCCEHCRKKGKGLGNGRNHDYAARGIFGLRWHGPACNAGLRMQIVDRRGQLQQQRQASFRRAGPHVPENWNAKKAFSTRQFADAERLLQEVETRGVGSRVCRKGRLQTRSRMTQHWIGAARTETAKALWQVRPHCP